MLARLACAAALVLVVLTVASPARAYGWMIRDGHGGCANCHADPSGGDLLTRFGRAQGDLSLAMPYGSDPDAGPEGKREHRRRPTTGFLWGLVDTPGPVLLGGGYRQQTVFELGRESDVATFPMQADLYGQLRIATLRLALDLGVAQVPAGSEHARAAQVSSAQGDELNLTSRFHWVGWDVTRRVLLRAGRIHLPFGVRVPEHTMWVRSATRTDRESDQQHGVSVAYFGRGLRGELLGIVGNYQINPDRYRERGYSLYAEGLLDDSTAVGVSSLLTVAEADLVTLEEQETTRQAHGAFARVSVAQPLVVLFELDLLKKSRRDLGYVGFVQTNVELTQGLLFGGTWEVMDQGLVLERDAAGYGANRTAGAGLPRVGGWLTLDWFFLPQLEARLDAVVRKDDPFRLLAQLHAYL